MKTKESIKCKTEGSRGRRTQKKKRIQMPTHAQMCIASISEFMRDDLHLTTRKSVEKEKSMKTDSSTETKVVFIHKKRSDKKTIQPLSNSVHRLVTFIHSILRFRWVRFSLLFFIRSNKSTNDSHKRKYSLTNDTAQCLLPQRRTKKNLNEIE